MRLLAACLVAWALALGGGMPAAAAWHEAESAHFVVYADDDARDIQRFSEMLERYHRALEVLTGRELPPPSPSGRVTIFAVSSGRDMRQLSGSRSIAGFYVPRAGRSRAFVQDVRVTNGDPDFSMIVLMHEYAHHFLIASSRFAMPLWLSEGAAEFFAAARFPADGSVRIGRPATHRIPELAFLARMTPEEIVSAIPGEEEDQNPAFYGNAWLLYHYLAFEPARKGQLEAYWRAVAGGRGSLEAAQEVFGDLRQLQKDLRAYSERRRLSAYALDAGMLATGPVSARAVSAGMAEMLPIIMVSQRGVDAEEAAELLPRARAVAARFPDDPGVLAALAEAEHDAGNDTEAIAVADHALAIDPQNENALVQKGYSLFRLAPQAEDQDAAYRAAMAPFQVLNRIENDHPLPLIYYYRSFAERGLEPNETARHALERAAELAPFDQALWWNAAMMQASSGEIARARSSLAPLAADPHGGSDASLAAALLHALADAPEGMPFDPEPILSAQNPTKVDADAAAGKAVGNGAPAGEPAAGPT